MSTECTSCMWIMMINYNNSLWTINNDDVQLRWEVFMFFVCINSLGRSPSIFHTWKYESLIFEVLMYNSSLWPWKLNSHMWILKIKYNNLSKPLTLNYRQWNVTFYFLLFTFLRLLIVALMPRKKYMHTNYFNMSK